MIMGEFWKTKQFSELKRKWAKRLAESGFRDHEKEINSDRVLVDYATNVFRSYDTTYVEARRKYFRTIDQWLLRDRQMPRRDRIIMEMYSAGMKQNSILEELKKGGIKCTHRITITRTITRYLHKWNIPILKPRKTK